MHCTHTRYAKLHVDIASEIEYTTLAMTEPKVNLYVVALETRHKPRLTDLMEWKAMLDKTQDLDEAVAIAEAEPQDTIVTVKVTNGGTIDVDIGEKMPTRIYKAIIIHGLQKLINRKSKSDKTDVMEPMARAEANLAAMYANTFKIVGSKAESGKASGPVMVEARRLALIMVKAEIKAQGIKLIHVPKTQMSELANQLLQDRPEIVKQAEASLKAATEMAAKAQASGKALKIVVDPKLVQAALDKKAKDKATAGQTLSAKQAGKVQVKSKPSNTVTK